MIITRLIQIAIIAAPVLLFVWLVKQWIVPSGIFFVAHTVGEHSSFIDELQPGNRVEEVRQQSGGSAQKVTGDPTFFFLHPHRDFDWVKLEIWFQNSAQPIVELGALSSRNPESYLFVPLHNRLIDESSWERFEENGLVLLQRAHRYDSIQAFFSSPPPREKVATYRTQFDAPYRDALYQPSTRMQTIDVSLRGAHEFKTYIKDEALSFLFSYMDMNRDEGADPVRLTIFNEANEPVAQVQEQDDGTISDAAVSTGLRTLSLQAPGLSEGVYKVAMNASRDIFFRSIETQQQKIVFLNSVFLGDEIGYREIARGATLWSEAPHLRVQTRHAQGVQTLTSDSTHLEVREPYEWYEFARPTKGLGAIHVPLGDLEIVTEGKIAFAKEQYFNPDPAVVSAFQTLDDLGADYVLAAYTSPEQRGEWLVATAQFDRKKIVSQNGELKITLSAPGIDESSELFIHQINAWFSRIPL